LGEGYSEFLKRLLSSIIILPIIIFIIFWDELAFFILLLIIIGICLKEIFKMINYIGYEPSWWLGFILSLYFIGSTFLNTINFQYLVRDYNYEIFIIIVIIFYSIRQLLIKEHLKMLPNISLTIFGSLYLGYLASYLIKIRSLPSGRYLLLILLCIIWVNDTSAYLIGSKFGRKKIFPKVSPKKTIEGSLAGIFFSIIVTFFFKNWLNMDWIKILFLGITIALVAQLGDFFESLIKRCTGVKNSSDLIPGHGGILDRLDSILFAAPVFYYFLVFLK